MNSEFCIRVRAHPGPLSRAREKGSPPVVEIGALVSMMQRIMHRAIGRSSRNVRIVGKRGSVRPLLRERIGARARQLFIVCGGSR